MFLTCFRIGGKADDIIGTNQNYNLPSYNDLYGTVLYEDENICIKSVEKNFLHKLYLYRFVCKKEYLLNVCDDYNNFIISTLREWNKPIYVFSLFNIKEENDGKIIYLYTDIEPKEMNEYKEKFESIKYTLLEEHPDLLKHFSYKPLEIIDKTSDNYFCEYICETIKKKKICIKKSRDDLILLSKYYSQKKNNESKWKSIE